MNIIDSIIHEMSENYDIDTISNYVEDLPYELIQTLLSEMKKLEGLVINTREEVNALTSPDQPIPYPDVVSDIVDLSFYDHPAVRRYEEIYGRFEF
jgi:hypothetical protein